MPIGCVHAEKEFPRTRRGAIYDYVLVHVDNSNDYIGYNKYYEYPGPVP